jgi:uncharacterized protein YecE (DUF72 family)
MPKILVGTCGYSYNEWVGPVFPVGTKPRDKLRLYAGFFPTVELDFSYYGMPKAENLAKMLIDGGPTFSIKAYKTLTHEINPATWGEDAKTYREAIEPLLQAGRLEAVLFQFPFSFHYEDENRWYLDKLLTYYKDIPLAVEFRNSEWFNDRVINTFRERAIPLVALDMPDLKGLPTTLDTVTGKLAYIRFHGRRGEAWWGSDKAAQFDYLYKDTELESWIDRIKRIAVKADRLLVYFNNHPKGKAVVNGQTFMKMLEKAGLLTT